MASRHHSTHRHGDRDNNSLENEFQEYIGESKEKHHRRHHRRHHNKEKANNERNKDTYINESRKGNFSTVDSSVPKKGPSIDTVSKHSEVLDSGQNISELLNKDYSNFNDDRSTFTYKSNDDVADPSYDDSSHNDSLENYDVETLKSSNNYYPDEHIQENNQQHDQEDIAEENSYYKQEFLSQHDTTNALENDDYQHDNTSTLENNDHQFDNTNTLENNDHQLDNTNTLENNDHQLDNTSTLENNDHQLDNTNTLENNDHQLDNTNTLENNDHQLDNTNTLENNDYRHDDMLKSSLDDYFHHNNYTQVTCISNVSSKTIPICESVNQLSNFTPRPVLIKVPVVLAEPRITISIISTVELEDSILEIKCIRKNVYLTQCSLLPNSGDGNSDIGLLFISGFIRKNIEYAAKECTSNNTISGNIKHTTMKIPFDCTSKIKFVTRPIYTNAIPQEKYETLINNVKLNNYCSNSIFGNDICEQSLRITEFFNEKVFCELINVEIIETDILENSTETDSKISIDKTFHNITEKVVLHITIKLLQNQQIQIP